MTFTIPEETTAVALGYVTTGAFNARDIAKELTESFEEKWNVTDSPKFKEYGDSYKVTITVEKV